MGKNITRTVRKGDCITVHLPSGTINGNRWYLEYLRRYPYWVVRKYLIGRFGVDLWLVSPDGITREYALLTQSEFNIDLFLTATHKAIKSVQK